MNWKILASTLWGLQLGCTKPPKALSQDDDTANEDHRAEPNDGTQPSDDDEAEESDTGPSTPPDSPTATVDFGPVIPCDDPLPSVTWTEQSAAGGLPFRPDDGRPTEEAMFILVDDFNQDGHLDLLTSIFGESEPDYPEPVRLYMWNGEQFEHDPSVQVEALWQPTLGDVDGDGDRDVLLAGSDYWLRNDEGILTKHTVEGIRGEYLPVTRVLAPMDLNLDGHLDVYGATTPKDGDTNFLPDFIAWGQSNGSFTIDRSAHPSMEGGIAFSAQWIDWSGDGHAEIYVANDKGYDFGENRLWSWDIDPPEDRAPVIGANQAHDAMGAHIADWNRDGHPDIYLSATAENILLVSQPDGRFADMSLVTNADPMFGLTDPILMGWGGIFTDHDNDGMIDLFVTLGDWWDEPHGPRPEMKLYMLRSDGERFESVGPDVGLDASGSFRGVIARDFNRDGIPDFLVSSLFGRPLWFVSDGCTANHWLEVEAPDSSHITVTTADGTQVGWATTNSGFGAIGPPVAHFGLGDHGSVDKIEVVFPGGLRWSTDGPIETRRRVTVRP